MRRPLLEVLLACFYYEQPIDFQLILFTYAACSLRDGTASFSSVKHYYAIMIKGKIAPEEENVEP